MNNFEKVHTMTGYYDGPRSGIADFEGTPHVYESIFDDLGDGYTDTFMLMPIDNDAFLLAIEDWRIWTRWEDARFEGRTPPDTHPALPEDRARHVEIERQLGDRLKASPERSILAKGEFRTGEKCKDRKIDIHESLVKWTKVEGER